MRAWYPGVVPFVLAIISGILSCLAFPGFSLWPLVFVAPVPLLVALQDQPAIKRLLLGWITGTIIIAGTHASMVSSLIDHGQLRIGLATAFYVAYCLYAGFQWALFGWLYGLLRTAHRRIAWLFTVPLTFAFLEWIYPAGGRACTASALSEVPLLLQSAAWIGAPGVATLVLSTSCSIVQAVEDQARGRATELLALTANVALWLLLAAWGGHEMQQIRTAPVRGEVTVALIQPFAAHQESTHSGLQTRERLYQRMVALTRSTLHRRPDLIVWPAGAFPFGYEDSHPAPELNSVRSQRLRPTRRLQRLAWDFGVPLLVGIPNALTTEPRTPRALFFSEALDPMLLKTTAEHWSTSLLGPSKGRLTESSIEAGGFRWRVQYGGSALSDDKTHIRSQERGPPDLNLTLTDPHWLQRSTSPALALHLLALRAIETRTWTVRASQEGISAAVDPTGTARAKSTLGEETVLTLAMPISSLHTSLYRRYGNQPIQFIWIVTLLTLLTQNRRRLGNFLRSAHVRSKRLEASEPHV